MKIIHLKELDGRERRLSKLIFDDTIWRALVGQAIRIGLKERVVVYGVYPWRLPSYRASQDGLLKRTSNIMEG